MKFFMKFIPINKTAVTISLLSLLGGFLSGFFGGGGGIVFIYILKKYYSDKKVIFPSTILLTVFSSAVGSTVYTKSEGTSSMNYFFYISGIIGAIFGCFIFKKFKKNHLELLFSALLIASGIIMILK